MKAKISPNMVTEEHGGIVYAVLPKGELKPATAIKPEHIEEDELVRRLAIKAADLNAALVKLREEIFADVAAFRDLLAEKYNVKKGGAKGNITLATLDGTLQLKIQIAETLTFGPELEIAKGVIDECIRRWSEGSNDNIRALVDQAFQVDKQGKINADRILALRRLKMVDETGEWEKAMNIISDSVRTASSKEHARFYQQSSSGDQERIALDLANA